MLFGCCGTAPGFLDHRHVWSGDRPSQPRRTIFRIPRIDEIKTETGESQKGFQVGASNGVARMEY